MAFTARRMMLAGVACVACSHGPSAPVVPDDSALSGSHALVAFQDEPLPAKVLDIPLYQGGPPSGCTIDVRDGSLALALVSSQGTFTISYHQFNSCTNAPAGSTDVGGRAIRSGNSITLTQTAVDGLVWTDTARVDATSIRVQGLRLVFALVK